jgi:hypothetical protein
MWNKYSLLFISNGIFFVIWISNPVLALANNPPDQGHSSLSVSNQAPANGSSTINVSVTLEDSSGNPVSGNTVSFSSPNDSTAVFNPTSASLNSSGQASFTVTSTNAGTDNITVTDTSSNTTLADLGQVVFTSSAPTLTPTPTCAPVISPQITGATSSSPNQITLTWTDTNESVTNYVLAYGLSSGKYVYGNPSIGTEGTTSYTVGSLSQGTTYYFAIQAVNSCSTSSFSNEISATAGGASSTTSSPTTATVSQAQQTSISPQQEPTTSTVPVVGFGSPTPAQSGSNFTIFDVLKYIFILILLTIVGLAGFFGYRRFAKKNKLKQTDPHEPNHQESHSSLIDRIKSKFFHR